MFARATILLALIVGASLLSAGCSGGAAESTPARAGPAPAPPPPPVVAFSVLTTAEAASVRDDPAVYAVEQNMVLQATVVTYDGAWTFADVNADIDDTDAVEPEINAHFIVNGYPDDGLQINATFRLRGSSTRLAEQKSYRIKLANAVAAWRGEKTLQFNKHPYDLTRLRNKLAFDLFRDIPHIPSLRTQFVRMSIENRNAAGTTYAAAADYGLFTHVEKMGKEYLANRGLPTDGNIYKAEDFQFRLDPRLALDATGKPVSKSDFEKVLSLEADNGNHQKLIAMLTELNAPGSNFDAVFTKYFDKANYLTWLASNILMGNRDTVNQNFALYQPKGSDKFYFLPWDYDGSFNFEDQPDQKAAGPLYSSLELTVANWWDVPLHQLFLQDPKRLEELKQAVDDIAGAYLTEAKIKAKIDGYLALVQPFISTPPDSTFLPALSATPVAEWASEAARIATVIKTNRDRFVAALETPMPFWQAVELDSGMIRIAWDASIDLQADPVTYTVQVSSSPSFLTIQQQLNATAQTVWTIPKLPNGIWYLRVTSRDAKGNTQIGFDVFTDAADTDFFGVLAFQVTNTDVLPLN